MTDPYCMDTINPYYAQANPAAVMTCRTMAQVAAKRAQLIQFIWKGAGLPDRTDGITTEDVTPPLVGTPATHVDELVIRTERLDSHAFLFHSSGPHRKLAVVQAGHQLTLAEAGIDRTITRLLERGFDVLVFYMPLLGPNTCPCGNLKHDVWAGKETSAFTPLRYFFDPSIIGLNAMLAIGKYDRVEMVGVSGGGWLTTWMSALDPRIVRSMPVAGSLPLFYRTGPCGGDWGDWEQCQSQVYSLVDYLDLYVMGGAGAGRQQFWVTIQHDPCCFWGVRWISFSQAVGDATLATGGFWGPVYDRSTTQHEISAYALSVVYP